ncbi:MAG: GntR family transcriptional regulator, partial [Thermotogaceae bacterium]|nr:GntR family transcriptional regulator [Thermotogaceae bacterium]
MKLYERATKQIIRMIESGGLAEGEMLPSESEL